MAEKWLHLTEDDIQTMMDANTVALESLTDVARSHPSSPARKLYDDIGKFSDKLHAYAKSIGFVRRRGSRRNPSVEDDLGINPTKLTDRERGRRWAKTLSPDRLHTFVDHHVLGEFDWRDWGFDNKPSGAFMNAAFAEAQMREELEDNPKRVVVRKPGSAGRGVTGREAGPGDVVLVGPDTHGDGGDYRVRIGEQVRIVSSGVEGSLVRRRVGSPTDTSVGVMSDGQYFTADAADIEPVDHVTNRPRR